MPFFRKSRRKDATRETGTDDTNTLRHVYNPRVNEKHLREEGRGSPRRTMNIVVGAIVCLGAEKRRRNLTATFKHARCEGHSLELPDSLRYNSRKFAPMRSQLNSSPTVRIPLAVRRDLNTASDNT